MGLRISGENNPFGYYYGTKYAAQQAAQSSTVIPVGVNYSGNGTMQTTPDSLKNMNTLEAMAMLNAKEKTNTEQKNKEKAQEKLAKLAEKLRNNNNLKLSDKHKNAMILIQNNPSLSSMTGTIEQKIQGAMQQQDSILEAATAQVDKNSTAGDIQNKIKSIEGKYQQLLKDWKAITKNLIIAGASSEAMMKVTDQTKKDKYYAKAMEAISQMPDAYKDKNNIKEKAQTQAQEQTEAIDENTNNKLNSEQNQEFDISKLFANNEGTSTEETTTQNAEQADQTSEIAPKTQTEVPAEENRAEIEEETHELNSEMSSGNDFGLADGNEVPEVTTNTGAATEISQIEEPEKDNETDEIEKPSADNVKNSDSNDDEPQEVSELKQEVQQEQIKQKKNPKETPYNFFAEAFKFLPSLLGL